MNKINSFLNRQLQIWFGMDYWEDEIWPGIQVIFGFIVLGILLKIFGIA